MPKVARFFFVLQPSCPILPPRFWTMAFADQIESLKDAALADMKAAAELAALEQIKGKWVGPQGQFTALMKQLGTLPKEERPTAGKSINAVKAELETVLTAKRGELELKAALPKEPTDFTLLAAAAPWANCTPSPR